MSEMTPEERSERIRRLQERRGTAADAPEVRRKRRRKHGVKTRLALTALTLASFGSLVGAMAVGQGNGTTSIASGANASSVAAATNTSGTTTSGTSSTGSTTAATTTPSATSASTSSATSGTTSQSTSTRAVTSTKGS
jgi:hypothetical protein